MCCATLREAAKLGISLVIVDASQLPAIRSIMASICPHAVIVEQDFSKGKGKGGALRQGIELAASRVDQHKGVIAFLEPEKTDCIRLLGRLSFPFLL